MFSLQHTSMSLKTTAIGVSHPWNISFKLIQGLVRSLSKTRLRLSGEEPHKLKVQAFGHLLNHFTVFTRKSFEKFKSHSREVICDFCYPILDIVRKLLITCTIFSNYKAAAASAVSTLLTLLF